MRTHFRELYSLSHSNARAYSSSVFMERFVDRQIDILVERVERDVNAMDQLVEQLCGSETQKSFHIENQVERSRKARQLGEFSGRLRRRLTPILSGLKRRDELRVNDVSPLLGSAEMGQVFDTLKTEFDEAKRGLDDYFLAPTNTVAFGDLKEASMLVRLHRIEVYSKVLQRGTKP